MVNYAYNGNYQRINWKNYDNTDTPLNADNLNLMDATIDKHDKALTSQGEAMSSLDYEMRNLSTTVASFDDRIRTNTSNISTLTSRTNYIESKVNNLEEEILDLDISARLDELEDVSVGGVKRFTQMETSEGTAIDFRGDFTEISSLTAVGHFITGSATLGYTYYITHADGSYGVISRSGTVTLDDETVFHYDSFSTQGLVEGDTITRFRLNNSNGMFESGTQITIKGKERTDASQALQDGDLLTYDEESELWVNKPMPEVDFGLFVQDGLIYCRYESE